MPLFSLIQGTMGRTDELELCLAALARQTFTDFELLVVDQNPDDRLRPILAEFNSRITIRHLRSARGLSKARNTGLAVAQGSIIAFPDDDSLYAPQCLERAAGFFAENLDVDGVLGRVVTPERLSETPTGIVRPIHRLNVFRYGNSSSLFFRRSMMDVVGGFDETLGPGTTTPWWACDDIDYPLRAMRLGFKLVHTDTITVGHPAWTYDASPSFLRKADRYGQSIGHVLRKHGFPVWYTAYQSARSFQKCVTSIATGKIALGRYHWVTFTARWAGYVTRLKRERQEPVKA